MFWSIRPNCGLVLTILHCTRSQRPTWNPWNEDGTSAADLEIGDGNLLITEINTQKNRITTRATYNIGFTLIFFQTIGIEMEMLLYWNWRLPA